MELSWGEPLQSVPIVNRYLKSVNSVLKVLQSWLSGEENVLPLQRTRVWFPAPASQSPVTPASGDPGTS